MVQETINRQILIDYLLGEKTEEEQIRLAERYFTDEDIFDQLLTVQADLVDRYVRGQLRPNEARALEEYLDRLPDGRHKIVVAQALMKIAAEEQPVAAKILQPGAWWRSVLATAGRPELRLVYSVIAVLIVLVLLVVWVINPNHRLLKENDGRGLELNAGSGQKQHGEQHSQSGPLQKDTISRDGETPGSKTQVSQIDRQHPIASTLVTWRLTPTMRNASNSDTIILGPNAKFLSLVAPIEAPEKYTEYRAVIQTVEGEANNILEERDFHHLGGRKSINIKLPADKLLPASYRLTLFLRSAPEEEVSRIYFFRIVKREVP